VRLSPILAIPGKVVYSGRNAAIAVNRNVLEDRQDTPQILLFTDILFIPLHFNRKLSKYKK